MRITISCRSANSRGTVINDDGERTDGPAVTTPVSDCVMGRRARAPDGSVPSMTATRIGVIIVALTVTLARPAAASGMGPGDGDTGRIEQQVGPGDRVPVPEASPEALRYYRTGMLLWGAAAVWGMVVPALILFTGFSATLRDLARRLGRHWLLSSAAYAVLYFTIIYLVGLPIAFARGFVREHAFGLSNQSFGAWLRDSLTLQILVTVLVALVVPVAYAFLRRSPRRWWVYSAGAATALLATIIFVYPIWIAPLFDDFGPMRDPTLQAEILALADRTGIDDVKVFEVNKSADTEAVNAYVAGFLNTKRVVLWDTIIEKLGRNQILFVVGHEMGHYVLGHAWQRLLYSSLLLLLALYVAQRSVHGVIARFRDRFGFAQMTDVASLPLFLLLFNALSFATDPVTTAVIRHQEHEADRFGLELTRNNYAAAGTWLVLQRENLQNPRPGIVFRIWRATHPALADRIEFANSYRPWETGEPLKYGRYFREGGS